jgi:superoxide reductase
MAKEPLFFKCAVCGNLAGLIGGKGLPLVCCGQPMARLVPNTVEASAEKHIPAAKWDGDVLNVTVGSVPHPMEDAHHIEFIYVASEQGGQRKGLAAGQAPEAGFAFSGDKPAAVYAYCNLHGLWKAEL